MLYINKENQIYSGDCLDNDRQLSAEEQTLYLKGYGYEIVNNIITDISQTPEYIANQEQKEQERINGLTMTALDFIQVIIKTGVTYDQVKVYLDSNAALEIHLKCCKDVYCGVIRQLCPLSIGEIILTEDMAIEVFEKKNNPDYQLTNGE